MNEIIFELHRKITPEGAFGMLWYRFRPAPTGFVDDQFAPFAVTLERTYQNAAGAFKSKIPDSVAYGWHCSRTIYHKHGFPTYEVHVPHHSRILFHPGNMPEDSDGCILVAEKFHDFDAAAGLQKPGIGESKAGFAEFMELANNVESFFLRVVTAKGV